MLPAGVQTVTGDGLETLVAAPGGGAALARVRDSDLYILADPNLIDNFSFASRYTAPGPALLLDLIVEDATAGTLVFDLTISGFRGKESKSEKRRLVEVWFGQCRARWGPELYKRHT